MKVTIIMDDTSSLVLRSVYLDPRMDEVLRHRAHAERKSKNALIRELLSHALSQPQP